MLVRGSWLESMGAVFIGICTSLCALVIGRDFGDMLLLLFNLEKSPNVETVSESRDGNEDDREHDQEHYGAEEFGLKTSSKVSVLVIIFVVMLAGTIVGAILDVEDKTRRSLWASSIFAPLGSTLRWILSGLNQRYPTFPLGTFIANMAAMLLDVIIGAVILTRPLSSNGRLILTAMIAGLGGSLSTVSTWLAESLRLCRQQKHIYIISTIAFAQLLGIILYGSSYWITKG